MTERHLTSDRLHLKRRALCVAGVVLVQLIGRGPFSDASEPSAGTSQRERRLQALPDAATPGQRRAAITTLTEVLRGSNDPRILAAFRNAVREHPQALDHVLPQLTGLIQSARRASSEVRLCDLLDTVMAIGHGPDELARELSDVQRDASVVQFASPKAAAALLKIHDRRGDLLMAVEALAWFGERLKHEEPLRRMTAAEALGRARAAAKPLAPDLVDVLQDPDVRVRVVAATALCRMGRPSERAAAVLRESLGRDPQAVYFKPQGVSEVGIDHRYLAVVFLGQMPKLARAAAADVAGLLTDDDAALRRAAAEALGAIGAATPMVMTALEDATDDPDRGVGVAASAALEQLNGEK